MDHEKMEDAYEDWEAGQRHYTKPRLYVREISGKSYCLDDELKRLRSLPRVIKSASDSESAG